MFNPSLHTATNKPIGLVNKPVDGRTYYYDDVNFVYRPYINSSEVLGYLLTPQDRVGQFSVIINTGGALVNGVITGGTNAEWWFKDGVTDADLVLKQSGGGTTSTPVFINIPAGTALPKVINMAGVYSAYGNLPQVQTFVRNGLVLSVRLMDCQWTYAGSDLSQLLTIAVYGDPDGSGGFADNVVVSIGVSVGTSGGGGVVSLDPIDDDTEISYALSDLESIYPTAVTNQEVNCANINTTYKKTLTGWSFQPYNTVT